MPINKIKFSNNNSNLEILPSEFILAYVHHLRKKGEDREITKKEERQLKITVDALRKAHSNLKQKCTNRSDPQYKNYGQRGIAFHQPWANSRQLFVIEAIVEMGLKPHENYSIERPDNDRSYEPGNIQWASPHQQAANRRGTRLIDFPGGIKVPLATVAHVSDVKPKSLSKRLDRAYIEDHRLKDFENNWRRRLRQLHQRLAPDFTREQRHDLALAINRLPPEVDLILVANAAIRFWPQFANAVEDEAGVLNIARRPRIEFFLRNLETALPFWQRQKAIRIAKQAKARYAKEAEEADAAVMSYEEWVESNEDYYNELDKRAKIGNRTSFK